MTSKHWQRVKEVFQAALERSVPERAAFLADVCGDDVTLRAEVLSLLAAHAQAGGFAERPPIVTLDESGTTGGYVLRQGDRFGPYHIDECLAAGGMGEVYRAHDSKLGRDVAIKVLPPPFISNPERRARFEREARVLAALNHAHIGAIYGLEESNDIAALVLELVEGPTLVDLLQHGPIAVPDALAIAAQIAEAIEAAHDKGIIHRDLKPANIKVTPGGAVKVLDFGLAKVYADDQVGPDLTEFTREGLLLGTPAYMSPEQARGQAVDKQTDIWAFGCVLYEMLTGRHPFAEQTVADTMTAVLEREPDWDRLPPATPRKIRDLARRCLRKDRAHRLHDIADARIEISEMLASARASKSLSVRALSALAVVVVVTALAAVGIVTRIMREPASSSPDIKPFTTYAGLESHPIFSPDGRQIAFLWDEGAGDNLYVKLVGGADPLRLTSNAGVISPSWSPNGQQIAFLRHIGRSHGVFAIPALGGSERRLGETTSLGHGLTWSPDGSFLITVDRERSAEPDALFLLSVETGQKKRLTLPPSDGLGDSLPALSPDGRTVAFIRSLTSSGIVDEIFLVPSTGGDVTQLTFKGWSITALDWTSDGDAIVFAGGVVGSARLWKLSSSGGEPSPLTFGERAQNVSVARTGQRLAYAQASSDIDIWRVGGPVAAARESPTRLIASTREDSYPRYSPDGRKVLFLSNRSGPYELWACNSEGRECGALTTMGSVPTGSAEWSPAGEMITFARMVNPNQPEILVMQGDTGQTRPLHDRKLLAFGPSWSSDGEWIYFNVMHPEDIPAEREIWRAPANGGPAELATKAKGRYPKVNPDGNFLYYLKGAPLGRVWKVDLNTGEESLVLNDLVDPFAWVLWRNWLIYARADAGRALIGQLDLRTGQGAEILSLGANPATRHGLTVSPDGRWIAYGQVDVRTSDIVLVEEGFR